MQNQISIESMKDQAKVLRGYLNEQGLDLSHSKSLEAVARGEGFKDWNTASALVSRAEKFWEDEYEKTKGQHPGFYTTKEKISFTGWQQVAGSVDVRGLTSGILKVVPTVTPFFEPRAVYIFGTELHRPSICRRFTVGAVTVGGSPQLAVNTCNPLGGGAASPYELISDVFCRPDQPLLVNWSVFSTATFDRELEIYLFNLNKEAIRVFACVWGDSLSDLD